MKNLILLTTLVVGLAWSGAARAQNFAIDWFTIDGGGGSSVGGPFALQGTIGQPESGPAMSGGSFALTGGFWAFSGTVPPTEVPLVSIERIPNGVRVFWPLPAAGVVLDETTALDSPPAGIPWSQVPAATYQTNSTHVFISIPMPAGNKFYRLRGL